ncbi:DUF116 domain-containing protein [candidate division KSB1 bacterium]|nr:DUF116 domain-containing protein [candidate division KSB1 bacterium]
MEPITYSLALDAIDSERYYQTVEQFADEVINHSHTTIKPFVEAYVEYLKSFNLEEIHAVEEYVLELLSFGILWRMYAPIALSVKRAPFILLANLGEWRKKHQRIKPLIDFARGVLFEIFLFPRKLHDKTASPPTLPEIDHVCMWFEATSDFREHALRFVRWRAFWGTLASDRLATLFSAIAAFTNWFEIKSNETLGVYTQRVNGFLQHNKHHYRFREDRLFCTRSSLEYHLNMIGAVLMNRAFHTAYRKSEMKAVLVPGCMRALPKVQCKAIKEVKGLKCTGCTPNCHVNQLRLLGQKQDFDVFVVPHASDLSLWAPKAGQKNYGVVASACMTTLIEGGLELKRYGVPAQCVPLEYCGCKNHWHPVGVSTALSVRELRRVL